MKNFTKKMRLISRLRGEMDDHIWTIFSRYKKTKGILFSSPDDWQIDDGNILFYGEDGCMGCYDPMYLSIPMKFFEDPETSFKELEDEIKQEKEEKENKRIREQQEREMKELIRLQEKYNAN